MTESFSNELRSESLVLSDWGENYQLLRILIEPKIDNTIVVLASTTRLSQAPWSMYSASHSARASISLVPRRVVVYSLVRRSR